MRNKRKISLLLAAAVTVASFVPCYASSTQDKIDRVKDEQTQTQSRLDSIREQIDELNAKKGQTQEYLEQLQAQLEVMTGEMEQLEQRYSDKQLELEQVRAELRQAEQAQTEQYDSMKERIQYMYETSNNNNYLSILLSAGNLTEFLNRAEYIQQLSSYDRDMLEVYIDTAEAVEQKEQQVMLEQQEIEGLQEQSRLRQEEVQEIYAATYRQVAAYSEELDDAASSQKTLLAEIEQQQERLNELLRKAKEEEIAAQRKAEEEARRKAEEEARKKAEEEARRKAAEQKEAEEKARQEEERKRQEEERKRQEADKHETSQPTQDTSSGENAAQGKYLGKFKVTAYCGCEKCCGTSGKKTASGKEPVAGRTIAMGGVPFGTKIRLNGHVYTVEDRGTAYGHIDVYCATHEEALAFGIKTMAAYQM